MFTYIYKQPHALQKFTYPSLIRKKSTLESEFVFCYSTLLTNMNIVIDLYSQQNPLRLSKHKLVSSNNKKIGKYFIIDVMDQVDPLLSYYKYILENCHIQRTSNKHSKHVIKNKLNELKMFQLSVQNLTARDKEIIDNTISIEYSEEQEEKKVKIYKMER